jgi:hypothetical protein
VRVVPITGVHTHITSDTTLQPRSVHETFILDAGATLTFDPADDNVYRVAADVIILNGTVHADGGGAASGGSGTGVAGGGDGTESVREELVASGAGYGGAGAIGDGGAAGGSGGAALVFYARIIVVGPTAVLTSRGTNGATGIPVANPAVLTGNIAPSPPTNFGSGGDLDGKPWSVTTDAGTASIMFPSGADAPLDLPNAAEDIQSQALGLFTAAAGSGGLTLTSTNTGLSATISVPSGPVSAALGFGAGGMSATGSGGVDANGAGAGSGGTIAFVGEKVAVSSSATFDTSPGSPGAGAGAGSPGAAGSSGAVRICGKRLAF